MLIKNPLEKFQNLTQANSNIKVTKNEVFHFYFCVQKCPPFNVSCFFQRFRTLRRICVLWYPYRIFEGKIFWHIFIALLLTSMQNADDTAQKNKNIFYIYVLVFHFVSFSCLGGFILSKKVKVAIHVYKTDTNRETCKRIWWVGSYIFLKEYVYSFSNPPNPSTRYRYPKLPHIFGKTGWNMCNRALT